MPAQRLTKPDDPLYKMTLVVVHHAYEHDPTVGLEVKVTFVSGETYTVAHMALSDGEIGDVPDRFKELADAFLWGDEAAGVVATVHGWDSARQSRRQQREARAHARG